MKARIFLIANPKFQLQILCSFGDITKSVKLIGVPENNFLCIFIIASSPGLHTFLCLWRVNKKLPQGETSQNAFQRSRSINLKWNMCMLEWTYPPLTTPSKISSLLNFHTIISWQRYYSKLCNIWMTLHILFLALAIPHDPTYIYTAYMTFYLKKC